MDAPTPTTEVAPAPSSFSARAANVFAAPAELYSEVSIVPVQTTSWAIPYIISLAIAVLFTVALFSNASLRQEILDKQQAGLREAVEQGRMTQEQFDQAASQMENVSGGVFIAFGAGSAIVMLSIMFFGIPLILWLAGKWVLKYPGGYKKILESYGLATLIGSLGAIVTLLLMYMFNTMAATPSAALAVVGSYDVSNKLHIFLSQLNIFTIWEVAVIGIALSKLTGKSTGVSMGLVFGLWLLWAIVATLLSLGV